MLPKLGVLLEQSTGLRDSKDAGPLIQGALAYNQLRTVAGRLEQVTRPLQTDEDALTQAALLRMPFALQPLYRFINHLSEMFEAEKKGRDLLEEVIRDEKQFKELVQLIDDADEGLSRYYHGLMLTSRALMYSAGPNRDDQRMIRILREAAIDFSPFCCPIFIVAPPLWHNFCSFPDGCKNGKNRGSSCKYSQAYLTMLHPTEQRCASIRMSTCYSRDERLIHGTS